jgi:hypothetical protein
MQIFNLYLIEKIFPKLGPIGSEMVSGHFERPRKGIISFVVSVLQSVRLNDITLLQIEEFS